MSGVDALAEMFSLREDFMRSLNEKTGIYPHWPLDVTKKQSQQVLRESVLRGVEEMFEALQELRTASHTARQRLPTLIVRRSSKRTSTLSTTFSRLSFSWASLQASCWKGIERNTRSL